MEPDATSPGLSELAERLPSSFILKDVSLEGSLKMNKSGQFKTELSVEISQIDFALDALQYAGVRKIQRFNERLNK
jgi:hypothetical protein